MPRLLVVSKRTAKSLRPELALAPGPLILAAPGEGTVQALYGCAWAFALYKDGPQLLQVDNGQWVERSDPEATAALDGAQHVSLAFDQAARPVLAWEVDGQVYVRQWSPQTAQYVTRGPWAGHTPILLSDVVVGVPVGESDVALFHLEADTISVTSRLQRDLYAVARPSGLLPSPGVLDQVVAAPWRFELLGEMDTGPITLLSNFYPVTLKQTASAALGAPASGDLFAVVIAEAPDVETAHANLSAPAGGELFAVVLLAVESETAHANLSAPAGGELFAVVLLAVESETAHADLSAPAGGDLKLAVVSVSLPIETCQASLSVFTGGKYETA